MTATDEAIVAIGNNETGDYQLEPRNHAERLPTSAGALKRVLQQPALLATIAGYESFDAKAGRAQKCYKGICKRLLLALGIVSVVGLIVAVAPWPEPYDSYVRWGAIVLVYAVMIYAFLSLRVLDRANPYKLWHQQRANAEVMRGQLFKTVMEAAPVGLARQGEIDLLPLKLEYVRRYHLDVQKQYYTHRANEHERHLRVADRWRKFGAAAILIWLICALIAGATPLVEPLPMFAPLQNVFGLFEWVETTYLDVVVLAVGLCVMVCYGFTLAISSISNDLRNAGRYRAYAKRVSAFYERLPEMRTLAIDPSNTAKVAGFVAELQDLFDAEHRDWKLMQETENREPDEPRLRFAWRSLNPFRPRPTQGSI